MDPEGVLMRVDWRVGRKRARNVYAVLRGDPDDDVEVGRMESDELAQYVVRLHNMALLRVDSGEKVVWSSSPSNPIQYCANPNAHAPHKHLPRAYGGRLEGGCPGRTEDVAQA